jgi:hypothetical protein
MKVHGVHIHYGLLYVFGYSLKIHYVMFIKTIPEI